MRNPATAGCIQWAFVQNIKKLLEQQIAPLQLYWIQIKNISNILNQNKIVWVFFLFRIGLFAGATYLAVNHLQLLSYVKNERDDYKAVYKHLQITFDTKILFRAIFYVALYFLSAILFLI